MRDIEKKNEYSRKYNIENNDAEKARKRNYYWDNIELVREKARIASRKRRKDPKYREEMNKYLEKWREKSKGEHIRRFNEKRVKKLEEVAGRPKPVICEVCGGSGRIVFDHDHNKGRFRGWICMGCNTTLGHVRDSKETLGKLIKYLEESEKSQARIMMEEELISLKLMRPKKMEQMKQAIPK